MRQEVSDHIQVNHRRSFRELPDNKKAAVIRHGISLGLIAIEQILARPNHTIPTNISLELGFMQLTVMDFPTHYHSLYQILHRWHHTIQWERTAIGKMVMELSRYYSGIENHYGVHVHGNSDDGFSGRTTNGMRPSLPNARRDTIHPG